MFFEVIAYNIVLHISRSLASCLANSEHNFWKNIFPVLIKDSRMSFQSYIAPDYAKIIWIRGERQRASKAEKVNVLGIAGTDGHDFCLWKDTGILLTRTQNRNEAKTETEWEILSLQVFFCSWASMLLWSRLITSDTAGTTCSKSTSIYFCHRICYFVWSWNCSFLFFSSHCLAGPNLQKKDTKKLQGCACMVKLSILLFCYI